MSDGIKYSAPEEIEADMAAAGRPTAYALQDGYPFSMLTDRQFECLLHDIASSRLGTADSRFGKFDRALLMQGVAERGRDCALVKQGIHAGLIQCKRYESLVTRPDAAREIIKFCLHALQDTDLMPDPKDFKYIFAVSKDFTEPAKNLLNAFNESVGSQTELESWIAEVVKENKSLALVDLVAIRPKLLTALMSIDVIPLGFSELNTLLISHGDIIERYFTIKRVVSDEYVRQLGSRVDDIAKSFTDSGVRRILDELNSTAKDCRFDFGLFSLWGYPRGFIQSLTQGERLKNAGMMLSMAKSQFDHLFLDYLMDRINVEIFSEISARGQFKPITIYAAMPYLSGRLLERWRRNQHGATLAAVVPQPTILADSASVRARILKSGEAFLREDWSEYVGDESIMALKKQIARRTFGDYATVDEMAAVFDAEWSSLVPILGKIETKIEAEIPQRTVVLLRDLQWFGDEKHVKDVFNTARGLDPKES